MSSIPRARTLSVTRPSRATLTFFKVYKSTTNPAWGGLKNKPGALRLWCFFKKSSAFITCCLLWSCWNSLSWGASPSINKSQTCEVELFEMWMGSVFRPRLGLQMNQAISVRLNWSTTTHETHDRRPECVFQACSIYKLRIWIWLDTHFILERTKLIEPDCYVIIYGLTNENS